MTNIDPLLQAILDEPENHFLKMVYADQLEEQGRDKEAKAWRWIARNGKYPVYSKITSEWDYASEQWTWDWWPTWYKKQDWDHALFSDFFLDRMTRYNGTRGRYETQLEAWNDLIRVLISMNEEELESGNH